MGTRLTCAAGTATSHRYTIDTISRDIRHLDEYEVPDSWDELVRDVLAGIR